MALRRVGEGISVVDAPLKIGGMHLGARMTVVELEGGLLLYSMVPIDDALAAEIDALGPVRWLIAPNLMHHLFAGPAKERYPEATLLAAEGLQKKRSDLVIDAVLDASALPFSGMRAQTVGGMPKLNETALLHEASRTLIVADLLFNIVEPRGWWTRMMLGIMKASGGPRNSKLLRSYVKDRDAHREGIEAILRWDFDRVVLSHGDVVETEGKAALREGASWNLPVPQAAAA